jgi:hypothetical protein
VKIRILRDWRRLKAGQVVDYDGGVADLLVRRHIAAWVKEEPRRRKAIAAPEAAGESASLGGFPPRGSSDGLS